MKVHHSLTDVNGRALGDAAVELTYRRKGANQDETTPLDPHSPLDVDLATKRLVVRISHPDYFEERVFLTAPNDGDRWLSTSQICTASETAGEVTIDATLGRVRFAPVHYIRPEDLPAFKEMPKGVLIEPRSDSFGYRGVWLNKEKFRRLKEPLFGDLDGKEWKRFAYEEQEIPLGGLGSFLYLEYGSPPPLTGTRTRYLIAVWVPENVDVRKPEILVFFTPNTRAPDYPADQPPYTRVYPYVITVKKDAGGKDLVDQPYVGVLSNYLVSGYKILYQLLAGRRNPIVVAAAQPSSNWGALLGQPGVGRLVKELVRFLLAKGLIGSFKPFGRVVIGQDEVSVVPPRPFLLPTPMPQEIKIILSGYSAGAGPLLSLPFGDQPASEQIYPRTFFASPAPDFDAQWKEIWDVDGALQQFGPWSKGADVLRKWVTKREGRRLRCYHTTDTLGDVTDSGLLDKKLIQRKQGKAGWLEEGQSADGRVSWAGFSSSALTSSLKDPDHEKVIPEFGVYDAHHFIICLAFGHAALLR